MDKAVLKYCKRRGTNLAMVWLDYQKAYDMITHSWISECLEVLGVAENTKNFLVNSINKWKLELVSNGLSLGNVEIWRVSFQGDSLPTLLFVLCMVPLSLILRKVKFHYEFGDKKTRINHLLFMDDLKLFAKSNNQIDSLVNTTYTFSENIGMEFGIKKCRVLVLKRKKSDKVNSRGLNLPNGKLMKTIDEEGYQCLGILKYDQVKEKEMKMEFVRECKTGLRLILISKLNETKAIKSWAVAIIRYGAGALEWKFDELKESDRKTWKLLTMHKGLHPKNDVDKRYVSRKKWGRGLVSCESAIRSEENNI